MDKILALTNDGQLTYCTALPELRGKGRCNHVTHQNEGESVDNFMTRIQDKMLDNKDKTEEISLENLKNQTPELCMAAVKQDGFALEYVKEQTEEICLEAVKRGGCALQYVKEQTPEICMAAVKQDSYAIRVCKGSDF